MKPKITYILKSVNADLTSYNNFQWKESGIVTCPDWNPEPECGNGLHGFLMGEGSGELANWKEDAKWLVLEVDKASVVDLIDKVKFPSCEVVFCGDRKGATDFIISKGGKNVIGSFVTSGYQGTSNSGYRGTSNSGVQGISNSGNYGTSTSGYRGTSNSGDKGTSNSGDKGILIIKYWNSEKERFMVATAYVGENGIEPNIPYKLDENHNFIKVST